jgi:threonine dehydrogenase-like Zn-dependent dehydrogenase
MKALRWHGKGDVRVEQVPDPEIVNPHDVIVRVTRTTICGSDLHLYDGFMPTMRKGDILGHEFVGEIVDVGPDVRELAVGDRVVVPFAIACGACYFCGHELWSLCDNSNPNAWMAETMYGQSGAGIFGYSHMLGGYAGGQAEYVRVPYADVGCLKIENGIDDEKLLFLTDIFPTGYMAAENCGIQRGDVIAVFGCGPVGQFAIKSAFLLGAERVIAIDHVPERLEMAQRESGAEIIDYEQVNVLEALEAMTGGRGPDACIDAVGMEAHGADLTGLYDRVKHAMRLQTDRPTALRYAIMACRKGGTISTPGVYGGLLDKVPFGAVFAKALSVKTGQTHVHRYMRPLLGRIEAGEIDPSFIITHRMTLDEAPQAYELFRDKQQGCVKVVLQPS